MRGGLHESRVEAKLRPVEEGREFGEAKRQALGRTGAQRDMAEFPARAGGFSVKVQVRVRDGQDFRGFREVAN